jgi:hypothetical protein
MGKGSNTTTTNQSQSYAPAGAGYVNAALQQGQNAAQSPFQQQAAPVAGFSPDQFSAFNTVRNAQGMAQPYISHAGGYFDQSAQGPNVSQFFNPYAGAVMGNLQDIFGAQRAQSTGQLTQAAGGTGGDRIAVGQSELAKQQGLAAGQTLSQLYQPSLSAAMQEQNVLQGAGYGTAALGAQAQNAALSGAQAQLGTGSLQQQLSQAQLNSPYQLDLARLAYPFQTAQFNAGITGALAPGLGGTTSGQGTTTGPSPSLLSQLLGLGTAGVGLAGGMGAFKGGSGNKGSNTGAGDGSWYGQSSVGGAPLQARGGRIGYDEGGAVDDNPYRLPSNFNVNPINVAPQAIVPNEALHPIQMPTPHLDLNAKPAQAQGGGADPLKMGMDAAKIAMMFVNRGGRVNPYGFAEGGDTDVINPDEPYRLAGPEAMDAWRKDTPIIPMAFTKPDDTPAPFARPAGARAAVPASVTREDVSEPSRPTAAPADAIPERDPGFAGSPWAALTAAGLGIAGGTSPFALTNIGQGGMQGLKTLETQRTASQRDETINQAARRLAQEARFHEDQFTRQTMGQKQAEKIAGRPYEEMTAAEKGTRELNLRKQQLEEMKPVMIGQDDYGRPVQAKRNKETGEYEIIRPPKKGDIPVPTSDATDTGGAPATTTSTAEDPAALPLNATATQGLLPSGVLAADVTPSAAPLPGTNPDALKDMKTADANKVRAIAEGRARFLPLTRNNAYNRYIMDKVSEYDPMVDETMFSRRSRTANFFAVGSQGGGGQNIASMNTFGQHADELLRLSKELNLGRFPTLNEAKNWMTHHGFGDTEIQKKLGEWQVAAKAVGDEGAKVFAGSNSALADREAWNKLFDASNPSSVTQGKLQEVVKLIGGRLNSLTEQYNDGMRTNHAAPDFIKPRTREIFEHILKGGAAPSAAPVEQPPAVGTRKQFKQGWGVWNGTSWVAE